MSSEAEFHHNLRSKIADRIANNPKSDYAEGDELYLPSGTKVIFISDLLTHRKGKDDGAQRAYVRLPDGSESSVFLRDLSPEPPQRESTPAQLVSRLLEDEFPRDERGPYRFHDELASETRFEHKLNELLKEKEPELLSTTEWWYVDHIEELEDGTALVGVSDDLGKRKTRFIVKIEWNGPNDPIPVGIVSHGHYPGPYVKSKVLWSDNNL